MPLEMKLFSEGVGICVEAPDLRENYPFYLETDQTFGFGFGGFRSKALVSDEVSVSPKKWLKLWRGRNWHW